MAKVIKPQEGFQYDFLTNPADIVIGGGAAGAGKTFVLLLEPLRNIHVKGFGGVFFRRTYPQITNEGGMWDNSKELYPYIKATPNSSNLEWIFQNGNRLKFSHLQYEDNIYDYQGAQIPYIAFDELTHFTEKQFFYLLSRNRSLCGVKPYVRATCNPDPESWVARFIAWWIGEDGYPIKEREGALRYFIRDSDAMVWGDSKDEVIKKCPHIFNDLENRDIPKEEMVKSVSFVPGNIYQNKELLSRNPAYLASLMAQDEVTKGMLLHGNWKIKTDESSLIAYQSMGDAFFAEHIKHGNRYISADIALHGSDRFVVGVWSGLRLEDILIFEKSSPDKVEAVIKQLALKHAVPRSHIIYDADGIGAYLSGYLSGAKGFNNGAVPIDRKNFKNLKTQCYYKLAELINSTKIFIRDKQIGSTFVRTLIEAESRAIKRLKPDHDGKLQIIPKEQMKNILGRSPDIMDMMMMRMYYEIKPVIYAGFKVHSKFSRA